MTWSLSPLREQLCVQGRSLLRLVQQARGQAADPGLSLSPFQLELEPGQDVVVYDQSWSEDQQLSPESFLRVVLLKLERCFTTVHLLSGEPGPLLGMLALTL